MRIVCPSCKAAYDVADSLVIPGRIVRCVRCGEEWVALTVEAEAEAEDEAPPEADAFPQDEIEPEPGLPRLTAMDRLARTKPVPQRGNALLRMAWIASFAVLLALLWGTYAWRGAIMHDWPASIRLYAALGLAGPPAH